MADDTEAISRSRAILAVLYGFWETRFPDSGPDLEGMEPFSRSRLREFQNQTTVHPYPPPPRRPCNLVFVVQGSTQTVNLTFSAPSVTGLTHRAHTAYCSRLDPQHKTHLMFACIAHPGSRLSERGEPRERVEAVDERLRRRAIVTADGVERIDACDTKRMGITHRQAGERGGCPLTGAA